MNTDERYGRLKILIEEGHIKELNEVFVDLTMTVVAADVGIKYQRLKYLLEHLPSIKVDDIESISRLLKVDKRSIFNLIANERENIKKTKKKK
jgi:hypothetical protein